MREGGLLLGPGKKLWPDKVCLDLDIYHVSLILSWLLGPGQYVDRIPTRDLL